MALKDLSPSRLAPWNWFRHEQDEAMPMVDKEQDVHPMLRLQQDMDRLFERSLRRFGAPSLEDWPSFSQLKPSLDISEREGNYLISMEIPGVKKEDISLTLEGNRLTIRGEKKYEHEEKTDKLHRVERSYGHFQRLLTLPDDARAGDIKAEFKDGVLKVSVPRQPHSESKAKQIDIGPSA
ncbi:Hsp20/alpha crystallin family protein [Zobellella sp. An-6]|uniref:Hsp20/alpha crystallin family protein n=1 Tax=Zobellella sp. An-6 TaxID=3400218 RepID=UPI0040427D85